MGSTDRTDDDLARLVALAEENELTGISVKRGDVRIAFRLAAKRIAEGADEAAEALPEEPAEIPAPPKPPGHQVVSQLVGVFYRCAPGKDKPLAAPGNRVTAGQPIGAIESMRVMNELTSDASGVILEYLVGDGQAVEYGQPVALIEVA